MTIGELLAVMEFLLAEAGYRVTCINRTHPLHDLNSKPETKLKRLGQMWVSFEQVSKQKLQGIRLNTD